MAHGSCGAWEDLLLHKLAAMHSVSQSAYHSDWQSTDEEESKETALTITVLQQKTERKGEKRRGRTRQDVEDDHVVTVKK